ncbi:jg16752, partial [Pararge aegeria aegeria]
RTFCCTAVTHLPGYVQNAVKLKSEGVAEIVCVSVNDPYVMAALGAQHNTKGKVRMLADPSGNFIKALDLGTSLPPLGGFRFKRFSMVINDSTEFCGTSKTSDRHHIGHLTPDNVRVRLWSHLMTRVEI